MTASWFEAAPALLDEVRKSIADLQPGLTLEQRGEALVARGAYVLGDAKGPLDQFEVEIRFPDDYPDELPALLETAGRIPQIEDRHVNGDGTACTCVPEEWMAARPDRSFRAFLEGPIKNFFVSQAMFEETGEWPFGQRAHGGEGMLEAYADILGVEQDAVRQALSALLAPPMKGHWPCPCGSGETFRRCHRPRLRAIHERIPRSVLERMMRQVDSYRL